MGYAHQIIMADETVGTAHPTTEDEIKNAVSHPEKNVMPECFCQASRFYRFPLRNSAGMTEKSIMPV